MLPVNGQDPPAFPVIEELEAVNAAHEWRRFVRIMTRIVSAPNVSNPAKLFRSPRDLFFVKTSALKKPLDSLYVSLHIQYLRLKIDVVSSGDARGWD